MTREKAVEVGKGVCRTLTIPEHIKDDCYQLAAMVGLQAIDDNPTADHARWIIERRARDAVINFIKKDWQERQRLTEDGEVDKQIPAPTYSELSAHFITALVHHCTQKEKGIILRYLRGEAQRSQILAIVRRYQEYLQFVTAGDVEGLNEAITKNDGGLVRQRAFLASIGSELRQAKKTLAELRVHREHLRKVQADMKEGE